MLEYGGGLRIMQSWEQRRTTVPTHMTNYAQSATVFWITILVYVLVLVWMCSKGWLFRAGIVTAIIATAPVLWQRYFTESQVGDYSKLFYGLGTLSLLLAVMGLIWGFARTMVRIFVRQPSEEASEEEEAPLRRVSPKRGK
jgi:hypothetical protein